MALVLNSEERQPDFAAREWDRLWESLVQLGAEPATVAAALGIPEREARWQMTMASVRLIRRGWAERS